MICDIAHLCSSKMIIKHISLLVIINLKTVLDRLLKYTIKSFLNTDDYHYHH